MRRRPAARADTADLDSVPERTSLQLVAIVALPALKAVLVV